MQVIYNRLNFLLYEDIFIKMLQKFLYNLSIFVFMFKLLYDIYYLSF